LSGRRCQFSVWNIIDSLKTNIHIDSLRIGEVIKDNYLISAPWSTLVENVQVNETITTLNIGYSTITDDDVKVLPDALKDNTTITLFHLDQN
jgi:hypothetical protein